MQGVGPRVAARGDPPGGVEGSESLHEQEERFVGTEGMGEQLINN